MFLTKLSKHPSYSNNNELNFICAPFGNINTELLKEQTRINLLSPEGIEIRIDRRIQVEGTFGQIK